MCIYDKLSPEQQQNFQKAFTNISMGGIGICLLYTSDAADERSSVDLGGRRIIKKKNTRDLCSALTHHAKVQSHTRR